MARARGSREPEKQLGVLLPIPLSVRLDRLLERVSSGDERTSRKELVAALIDAAASQDPDVHGLVRKLRRASVARAMLADDELALYLVVERRPGPRTPRERAGRNEAALAAVSDALGAEQRIDARTPLGDIQVKRVGLAIPRTIDRRLEQLVRAVERDGGYSGKGEVLAALVLAAPEDPEVLAELVRGHRRAQLSRRRRRSGPRGG